MKYYGIEVEHALSRMCARARAHTESRLGTGRVQRTQAAITAVSKFVFLLAKNTHTWVTLVISVKTKRLTPFIVFDTFTSKNPT